MIVAERVTNLEEVLAHYIAVQERTLADIRASNARTDARLLELQEKSERGRQQAEQDRREDAERSRQWVEQAEHDRKDFNKRMAEISDSMGRLIEDLVAPCGFHLANAIFGTEQAQSCAIRIRRKHPTAPGRSLEYDLMAVGLTKVLVVEAKWTVAPGKARDFLEQMAQLPEFFPEYADRLLCPAVASVYLEPSVVAFLNREKIYGIAMGDETMQVVNLGQF
jgi:hypothetical protein